VAAILIVEDDPMLRELVSALFERERYRIIEAGNAQEMRARMGEQTFDLILLDVRLPDGDGFELLRELRAKNDIPIVMLTGLDTPVDRVLGLEFGADDYICKPFEPRELVARVKSVLRRTMQSAALQAADGKESTVVHEFANYRLDTTHRTLVSPKGDEVELTSGEFDLLAALVESPNRPLTRDQLLDRTRSREWSPFDRSIDVLVARIRKKIEDDPTNPRLIKTVRSVGYVLSAQVEKRNRHAEAATEEKVTGSADRPDAAPRRPEAAPQRP
jgi:DNA-binding response OmpR family regulator